MSLIIRFGPPSYIFFFNPFHLDKKVSVFHPTPLAIFARGTTFLFKAMSLTVRFRPSICRLSFKKLHPDRVIRDEIAADIIFHRIHSTLPFHTIVGQLKWIICLPYYPIETNFFLNDVDRCSKEDYVKIKCKICNGNRQIFKKRRMREISELQRMVATAGKN
jgi:hypothetical protein